MQNAAKHEIQNLIRKMKNTKTAEKTEPSIGSNSFEKYRFHVGNKSAILFHIHHFPMSRFFDPNRFFTRRIVLAALVSRDCIFFVRRRLVGIRTVARRLLRRKCLHPVTQRSFLFPSQPDQFSVSNFLT